jgi:hypothetical protein
VTGFQFKTAPYAHQLRELEDHWGDPARALLWQMRTGKTKVVIDTAVRWHVERGLRGVIVVAPVGVHDNWVRRELPKHCAVPYAAHAWDSASCARHWHKRAVASVAEAAGAGGLGFLSVSAESLLSKAAQAALRAVLSAGPCALFVDESHMFKSPGSQRTVKLRGLAKRCVLRRILSGTAVGNSPLGMYSQFEVLERGALGFTRYSDFKGHFAVYERAGRSYEKVSRYVNLDELRERVARWSSVVLRSDCEDLPAVVPAVRGYAPSTAQRAVYEGLRERYEHELAPGVRVEAPDAGVRLLRLQQVLSNFVVDSETFEVRDVDPSGSPRLEALADALETTDPEQVIVWCWFREDFRRVGPLLDRLGVSFVEYHGGVGQEDRARAVDAFQAGEARVFLGQPKSGGQGLDLSAAGVIVWYSHTFDSVVREQACERATAAGGDPVALVDIAAPKSVDEYMLKNTESKRSLADDLAGRGLRAILKEVSL